MRSLLITLVIGLLTGCSKPTAAGSDAGLQDSLNEYFGALLQGKQRVTIDMMDPRFFPDRTVQAQAVALLEASTATFVYHNITNGQPFGQFKGSNSIHCF